MHRLGGLSLQRWSGDDDLGMSDVAGIVNGLGGMAQKQQLVRRGARDFDLTAAVRTGSVTRVRNGWYSTLPTTDPRVRAVRVGGRLTGVSAIAALGGWVLENRLLHVSVPRNAARLRTQWNRHRRHRVEAPGDVSLHWDLRGMSGRGTTMIVGLTDALVTALLDESLETAVACLDWALHTNRIDVIDLEEIVLGLPEHLRFVADWVDIDCESLPESLARTRLRLAGRSVTSQVRVGDFESIDLVIEDVVGLEVDGERFHVNRFERDRNKDLTMTIAKYHAIRPAAVHVFDSWDRVELAITVALEERGIRSIGNSGVGTHVIRMCRAMAGPRRRRRRSTPEFPKVQLRLRE